MKANRASCFYCGRQGHLISECEEVKLDVEAGLVKMDSRGKLRLKDGTYIPNMRNVTTIKEKVRRYYAERPSQYWTKEEEKEDALYVARPSSQFSCLSQNSYIAEDPVHRRARLEYELDLKEREEELEVRKLLLEQEERISRARDVAQILEILEELTDEEIEIVKSEESGFQ